MINRRTSIAPMMACTDRHYRYLARLCSQHTLLYTEMVTSGAILHGDRQKLLGFDPLEQPLALQIGGSDPVAMAECARIAEQWGYAEININAGCPSERVQAGAFGACLMKEPDLVARCFAAMQEATTLPVTIKTRLGVDDFDNDAFLYRFIEASAAKGCNTFIMHARKAWLQGLSPRENRNVPPLQYERVYRLKERYPELEIIINGGIKTLAEMHVHLQYVDGVMLGRKVYEQPGLLLAFDREFYADEGMPKTEVQVIQEYLGYVRQQLQQGVKLRQMLRHLVGFFPGQPGARLWRRYLSEHGGDQARGAEVVEKALELVAA